MEVKEKLIKILSRHMLKSAAESLANELINSGVTIQEWTPVSKPPKKNGRYLTLCEGKDIAQIRLFEGDWDSFQKVTHWMPLPGRKGNS